MNLLIIIILAFVIISILACCKLASDCSREEEKRDGK